MNRKWLVLISLLIGDAVSSSGATLQFTNVTAALFPGLTNRLAGVAYDGNASFVAVGDSGAFVNGRFVPGEPLLTGSNWTTGTIPTGGSNNLLAVASGGSLFVATGDRNLVFTSSDGVTWGANGAAFPNAASAAGIAYNSGTFVAVAKAPQIAFSSLPLPATQPWVNSTDIRDLSFLESFRGVTTHGMGGFAACGLFGVVRTSSNAGVTWEKTRGLIGEPDLLGIASIGTTLVAVGAADPTDTNLNKGVIVLSTNNGATWSTPHTQSSPNTPLNGVATTGTGFITVGTGGRILASDDNGSTWAQLVHGTNGLPAGFSVNLFGAAFANNGFMQGVGMLVGSDGAVILAGTTPEAPQSNGDRDRCQGDPLTNSPLSVTIIYDDAHPSNSLVVDWYTTATGGTPYATNTTTIVPTDDAPLDFNTPSNYCYFAETRDLRTGFVSAERTKVTLTINPLPRATLTSLVTTNCNLGTVYTLTNTLTGIGPWVVTWNDGTVQTNPTTGPGPVELTRDVTPLTADLNAASNNMYFVTTVSNPATGCVGTRPGGEVTGNVSITINPRPTATLTSFATTNCDVGTVYTLTNTLTGIGPWVVTWNDGTVQTNSSVGPGPETLTRNVVPVPLNANAASNTIYQVVAVSNPGTGCTGQSVDIQGTVSITINPRPTATLTSFATTNCDLGTIYTLTNTLNGIGPWVVTWNDGTIQTNPSTGPGPVIFTRDVMPYPLDANTASTNLYEVTAVSNPGTTCSAQGSDIQGMVNIRINPLPTATVVTTTNTICSGDSIQLRVNLTGIGPWNLTWLKDGLPVTNIVGHASPSNAIVVSLTNTTFTAPETNVFTVTNVSTANGCSNNAGGLSGAAVVVVEPRPIAIVSGSADFCTSGIANIRADLVGIGPFTVVWNDGYTNENVMTNFVTRAVAITNTNSFAVITNTFIVTNLVDAGLSNACGFTNVGAAVVRVYPAVTAVIANPEVFVRTNQSTNAIVNLTGALPLLLAWDDGFTQTNFIAGPATRSIHATNVGPLGSNRVFTLTSVQSVGTSCSTNLSANNTFDVTVIGTNLLVLVQNGANTTHPICAGSSTNLVVSVQFTSPKSPPGSANWDFQFSDGFVWNNVPIADGATVTLFRTSNVSSNVFITVTNVHQGSIDIRGSDILGSATVIVRPLPTGSVPPFPVTNICLGSTANVSFNLTGASPWMVTWSDGFMTNVASSNSSRTVSPTSNTVFALTAVIDANGCVATNLTGGKLVNVNPLPTGAIAGTDVTNCAGTPVNIDLSLTGAAPWNVTWSDGFVQTNVASSNSTRMVAPAASTNYTLTAVTDGNGCSATNLTGSVSITVNPLPTAAITGTNVTICDTNMVGVDIPFLLTGTAPWTVGWSDGFVQTNVATASAMRTVLPTNTTVYAITNLVDANGCVGTNLTGSVTVTVTNCPAPSLLTITMEADGKSAIVSWQGNAILQCSDGVSGSWSNVMNGGSPGTMNYCTNPVATQQFFRLVAPPSQP